MNKIEFEQKLIELNLTIKKLSVHIKEDDKTIKSWKTIPTHIVNFLYSYEYKIKFQKLQREFLSIKQANKWKFELHHQAIYDFVVHEKRYVEFCINDYDIIIRKGNKDFGFMHFILRHFGNDSDGEIKALDILKLGNVIKQDITIPAKSRNRIVFIQNKNNIKYTVILKKEKSGKLLFNFFSDN